MAVSRRKFLQQGTLAAAAACLSSPVFALGSKHPIAGDEVRELPSSLSSGSGNWQDHTAALQGLTRGSFTAAIGTSFKVFLAGDAQPVWMTLVAVEDPPQLATPNTASFAVPRKGAAVAPSASSFVLRFSSSALVPQETHLIEHESLGRFALFTVPEGRGLQSYVAVVNRLDNPAIIAVPYPQSPARLNNNTAAPASAITSAPATSSGTENLLHAPSESPAARRASVRD